MGGSRTSGDQTRLDVLESSIKLGNVTRTYTADYAAKPGRLCYAIRFKSNSNSMRTAFRYKYEGNGDMKRLEIKCRYLGNSSTRLEDISNEAYWTDVEPFVVSFRGYYDAEAKEYKERGATAFFWTSSSYSFRGVAAAFINQYTARVWGFDKEISEFTVRLYKRD